MSEASISSAIKQIRQALGDDGESQRMIRTVRGRGFRFVAELEIRAAQPAGAPHQEAQPPQHGAGRPGIAVLRFLSLPPSNMSETLARAVPAEIITGLSRMRWLRVIARGSSFRFDLTAFDPADIARQLEVGYLMSGEIETRESAIRIHIEIQSAHDNAIVWSESFEAELAEIQVLRSHVVAAVIAALELTIPQYEAQRTRVLSPNEFDAWSHLHLGLTQAFQFTQQGNDAAGTHFKTALMLDPDFARGHAGMSFVHWQNAFMHNREDRKDLLVQALGHANRAIDIDPTDPMASFSMGRALWLTNEREASVLWLERGLEVNPNYAMCHYTKGLVLNMRGDYEAARDATQKARFLSPLDPMQYGMLTNQTVSEVALGNLEGAIELAERSVNSPGSYYYPILWAAIAAELSGNRSKAERWRDRALAQWPAASIDMMMQTFPLDDPDLVRTVRGSLSRLGLS